MSGLLDVKETLSDNLSGPKIDSILNSLLFNSFNPLCTTTRIIKCFLASLLIQSSRDHRKKICSVSNQQSMDYLYNAIVQNKKQTARFVKKAKLDRGIISYMLEYIYKVSQSYNDLSIIHNKNLSTLYRDLYVIGASVERFGAALNWSKAYYREYIKFRNMIMEKYVRFAWNQSQKSKFETNLVVDYEELHINYMLAVVKAIDRYDPTRGPLTACVRGWIQEAKTNPKFNHVYGQSYEMNQEKRNLIIAENKQNSFSDQLENNLEVQDTKDLESALAIDQERSELYDFLVKTKGTKIARLSYGIPYSLSDEEKQSLLSLQEIKS